MKIHNTNKKIKDIQIKSQAIKFDSKSTLKPILMSPDIDSTRGNKNLKTDHSEGESPEKSRNH